MEGDVDHVLMSPEELRTKCEQLGAAISQDYKGKTPVLVCVLQGAIVFMADLLRCIRIPVEVESIAVSSYGKGSVSGDLKFLKDVNMDIAGRDIILVEDIVDTGKTLKHVCNLFAERKAASVAICTLLDKKSRREVEGLELKYVGSECPDEFVVGYGIDYAERYRNLPYVAALKRSVYE
eukprot:CAMPEP_0170583356 /NCGR_PEP_ID=MMETSP0224-20130122/8088_1 /TAXON_ID=285029 /ORGANISM="Togula jolla, Strain CCCM 725" /LENGTH=178 /DNA_ID=CAMNT_0010906671 /DNA_START=73 /DNA_END=606 /DNA_ORIENTATION=+